MNLVAGNLYVRIRIPFGLSCMALSEPVSPYAMHALFNFFGTVVIDFESRFFPDFLLGLVIMASVPLLIIVLVMMHFGIGEKKKGK